MILQALALTALAASAGALERPLPRPCDELAAGAHVADASATVLWNHHYRAGFAAIRDGDLGRAEREMCSALAAARGFAADDWRFAETLDELGLIAYSRGELAAAERLQGAAVAEILLIRGPGPQAEEEPSCKVPSVPLYLERLGIALVELGRRDVLQELEARPYLIFDRGYMPLDAGLVERLDGLISEYLRCEDLAAADHLGDLIESWLERQP